MTALLTENLPLLARAPNGIKKLRELILMLAVRGKLVLQDSNDEPASELLKRITEEKDQLAAQGKIKKQKPQAEITEEEKLFDLPTGWEWVRFGKLIVLISGQHLGPEEYFEQPKDGSIPYLTGPADFGEIFPLPTRHTFERRAISVEGDILLTVKGSGVGKTNFVNQPALAISRQLMAIRPTLVDAQFARNMLLSMAEHFQSKSIGIAIPGISREDVLDSVIGIPPLDEQLRIVAKVDELMALCDRLEAQQADAESAHARLVQALLDSLTQASDATDFANSWQRLAEHFHTLFSTESSIDALRQSLLQLSVMGKLVPQDRSDKPVSDLLAHIAEEKTRLVAEGKLKKQKPLLEITDAEKPFGLPEGWEWVRLDSLLKKIGAGSTPLGGKQGYVSEGIKFLRSQNVWDEGLRLDDVALIPESTHQKMSGTHVEAGDLLFNITGASIGRCAVVPDDFDTGNVSQHVTIIRPIAGTLRYFLHVVMTSQLVQKTVMDVQVGVSREGLSIGKLAQFVIPCPPEAEQHRIVAKVDQLMTLCDQLKARLTQARQFNGHLTSTLIEQAMA